jgi:hypothetical protein
MQQTQQHVQPVDVCAMQLPWNGGSTNSTSRTVMNVGSFAPPTTGGAEPALNAASLGVAIARTAASLVLAQR